MTLKSAIQNKDIKEIRKITAETPPAQIASILTDLSNNDRVIYFRLLNTKVQSEIFSYLDHEYQELLVKSFSDDQIKSVVSDLFADEIADIVEDVPEDIASRILKNTNKTTRADVNKILRYKDDVVGSFMTVDIVTLKQSISVGDAIKLIKSKKDEIYMGHYFMVVNKKGQLSGSVTIEDLLFSSNSKRIKDLSKPIGYVTTMTNKEEAANYFAEHDVSVLPVLNNNKQVIAVITSDDVIDVIQEAATEDMQKMAGIDYDDIPYSKQRTFKLFKSRIIWLMLLMISATISQIVLDAFQGFASDKLGDGGINALSAGIWTTAIVAILPVISGAAGNAGSQSSTMVIRSLAIGDITTKDYLKVVWKEIKVSNLVGITLGVANFIRLLIYYSVKGDLGGSSSEAYIFLSLAASLALYAVIILAKVVGGTLPIVAKKMKLDPAVMAAPLLTTLIDALSTMIFFGISIGIMILVL